MRMTKYWWRCVDVKDWVGRWFLNSKWPSLECASHKNWHMCTSNFHEYTFSTSLPWRHASSSTKTFYGEISTTLTHSHDSFHMLCRDIFMAHHIMAFLLLRPKLMLFVVVVVVDFLRIFLLAFSSYKSFYSSQFSSDFISLNNLFLAENLHLLLLLSPSSRGK